MMDAGQEAETTRRLIFLTSDILMKAIKAKGEIEAFQAMIATIATIARKMDVNQEMSWLGRLLTWSMEITLENYPALVVVKNSRLCV